MDGRASKKIEKIIFSKKEKKNFSLFTPAMQMKFDGSATADKHKKA